MAETVPAKCTLTMRTKGIRQRNASYTGSGTVLIIFFSFLCHDSAPMWITANQWNEESMLKQSNNALLTIMEGAMTYPWRNVPVNDSFSKPE